jgi:Tfp pilus assembly protein PilX
MRNSRGQALVLVLLSLAVVLTLVLFILARSVTDVAISSREEEAIRAFSAAEAGVEKALVIGTNSGSGDTFSYSANVSNFAEGTREFAYPINLSSGDTATIWFVAHDTDGNVTCTAGTPCFTGSNLKVCWGKSGTGAGTATTPAVELSVFFESSPSDSTTAKIARATFDPNSGRRATNAFGAPDSGTCTVGGETFQFQKTIDLSTLGIGAGSYGTQGGLQFGRLRMLYNSDLSHKVGFSVNLAGDSVLPSQGLNVDSEGAAGESNRRLSVFQGWPEAPSVLDYSVYSSTGLTK